MLNELKINSHCYITEQTVINNKNKIIYSEVLMVSKIKTDQYFQKKQLKCIVKLAKVLFCLYKKGLFRPLQLLNNL